MTETVVAAAIVHNGECFAMPRPARHHTIIHAIARKVPESEWPIATGFDDQGFITSNGRYVTRDEAFMLASVAGQFDPDNRASGSSVPGKLFSEDLW